MLGGSVPTGAGPSKQKGNTVTNLPAVPQHGVLEALRLAGTPAERAKIQAVAMDKVEDPRFDRPVPRFITELPYGGDDDSITDRIASAVLVAEDPDQAQKDSGTTAGMDLIGRPLTVHDLAVLPGNKPGGWGAFLLLDVTVGDDEVHTVVNTGAKQAVARLARCWADGQLPVAGCFAHVDGTGRRGTPVVTFLPEPALP